jgi:hypothetical protein
LLTQATPPERFLAVTPPGRPTASALHDSKAPLEWLTVFTMQTYAARFVQGELNQTLFVASTTARSSPRR